MKKTLSILFMVFVYSNFSFAQVGIGTTSPDASSVLHIESTDKGLLIPKLSTTQINAITNPANGLIVFNTTTNRIEYNSGTTTASIWTPLNTNSSVYMGAFIISGIGNQTISGLPFMPSSIKFSAHANVERYNINADNGVGNNNNTFQNAYGTMMGFATNYNGGIQQQVIYVGGNGNSINDISRYASNARAIGIRYSNQNGNNLGLTAASIASFNNNGFTIDVTDHTEDIVVIFEAYR